MRRLFLIFLAFLSLLAQAQESPALSASDKAALGVLADVLENPAQRTELIKQLRAVSGTSAPAALPAAAPADNTAAAANDATIAAVTESTKAALNQAVSLPRKFAAATARIAAQMGDRVKASFSAISNIFSGRDYRLSNINWPFFWEAVRNLGIIIAAVLLLYQGLRGASRPLRQRLNHWSLEGRWPQALVRKICTIAAVVTMDSVFLAIAYASGTAFALYAVGQYGQQSTQASLFMNAFIVIELLKIGLRIGFLTRFPGLRLLSADNGAARFWYRWLARLLNLLGYGYLVAIPLIEEYMSYGLAQAVSTVIAIGAFIYGVRVVISKRRLVRDAMLRAAENAPFMRIPISILAHLWHLIALAYFLVLLIVTLLYPQDALPFMMQATLKTLGFAGAGMLISALLTDYASRRIRLPENWSRAVPSIERHLNAYVPLALRLTQLALFIAIILNILSCWNLINLSRWASSADGQAFINRWLGAAIILIICAIVWIICCGIIEHRLSPDTGSGRPTARAETLLSLMKNAFAIIIAAICSMMFLSQIGINIGPLIAGAGVLGLAVGFGSQTLVKDIITGIFIQLEGAMNTGDFVTVDGISGTAERITIRSVGIRDSSGTYHLIPFSSVTTVSNFMRGFAYHLGEYGISYNDDIDEACEQLKYAFDELAKGEHRRAILEPITIQGVSSLGDSSVNIRIRIKTLPGEQWAVGRAYNRLVKLYFDRAGIEIPYPHQTLYFGENKDGSAPPLNVRHIKSRDPLRANMAAAHSTLAEDSIPPVPLVLKDQKTQDTAPDNAGQL